MSWGVFFTEESLKFDAIPPYDIVEQYSLMKLFFTFIGCSLLALSSVHASSLHELQDAIDDIESKIDNIDLDQSKEDIQADLDALKEELEELKS
jgi:peptidoglycan hydrolase CwlO-like protein